MPRNPGQKWKSDQRPYFKEPFDRLLDEPDYLEISAEAFRFRILFRALLKRAWNEDGRLRCTRSMLTTLSGKKQHPSAMRVLHELVDRGIFAFEDHGESVEIYDPNWLKDQRFRPASTQRNPDAGPDSQSQSQTQTHTTTSGGGEVGEAGTRQNRGTQVESLCPDHLDDAELEELRRWARRSEPRIDLEGPRIHAAWETFRSWARSKALRRTDWSAFFRGQLANGWPLESRKAPKAGVASRDANDVLAERKRRSAEDDRLLGGSISGHAPSAVIDGDSDVGQVVCIDEGRASGAGA